MNTTPLTDIPGVLISKRVEFNKLDIQQNPLAANYIGVSTARTALLSAEFVAFLKAH